MAFAQGEAHGAHIAAFGARPNPRALPEATITRGFDKFAYQKLVRSRARRPCPPRPRCTCSRTFRRPPALSAGPPMRRGRVTPLRGLPGRNPWRRGPPPGRAGAGGWVGHSREGVLEGAGSERGCRQRPPASTSPYPPGVPRPHEPPPPLAAWRKRPPPGLPALAFLTLEFPPYLCRCVNLGTRPSSCARKASWPLANSWS